MVKMDLSRAAMAPVYPRSPGSDLCGEWSIYPGQWPCNLAFIARRMYAGARVWTLTQLRREGLSRSDEI